MKAPTRSDLKRRGAALLGRLWVVPARVSVYEWWHKCGRAACGFAGAGPKHLMRQLTRILRPVLIALAAFSPSLAYAVDLLAAVLPSSRSVQVGQPATAFATMLNVSGRALSNCRFTPQQSLPATFAFFKRDLVNNVLGPANQAASMPVGGAQNFVFELRPTAAISPTEITFNFVCDGAQASAVSRGVNTFLFSASTSPVLDLLSVASVLSNDGITNAPGIVPEAIGIMSVAAINIGVAGTVTAEVAFSRTLPATVVMCQTNPANAQCIAPARATPITTSLGGGTGSTPVTFAIFVNASQEIPFDPENRRIVVTFKDSGGAIRGQTSTALRTRNLILGGTNTNGVWTDVQQSLSQIATSALPGTNVDSAAAPALKAFQQSILFSDLRDISIDSADQLSMAIKCIFLRIPNEELAGTLVGILSSSILKNRDRVNASRAAAARTSGVVFQNPQVSLSNCP